MTFTISFEQRLRFDKYVERLGQNRNVVSSLKTSTIYDRLETLPKLTLFDVDDDDDLFTDENDDGDTEQDDDDISIARASAVASNNAKDSEDGVRFPHRCFCRTRRRISEIIFWP